MLCHNPSKDNRFIFCAWWKQEQQRGRTTGKQQQRREKHALLPVVRTTRAWRRPNRKRKRRPAAFTCFWISYWRIVIGTYVVELEVDEMGKKAEEEGPFRLSLELEWPTTKASTISWRVRNWKISSSCQSFASLLDSRTAAPLENSCAVSKLQPSSKLVRSHKLSSAGSSWQTN